MTEKNQYTEYSAVRSSNITAEVQDIPLGDNDGNTRQVLRAKLVDNPADNNKRLSIQLVHQRRKAKDGWGEFQDDGWLDDVVDLRKVRAGECAKLTFDTSQTRELSDHLLALYEVANQWVKNPSQQFTTMVFEQILEDASLRKSAISSLLQSNYGEDVWNTLIDQNPDLASRLAISRIYQERKKVVQEFEASLPQDKSEEYWQKLLEKNLWIFGSSYIGRVGERRIDIKHAVDHPLISEDGCLEVVEIKRPSFEFWAMKQGGQERFLYRDKFLVPNPELQKALVQAQHYIFELEKEIDSKDWQAEHDNVRPLKPKCLVVHGRSDGWGEKELEAFRLLNCHLHGIFVITFDHLLIRAKQSLKLFKQDDAVTGSDDLEEFDIPF